MKKLYMKQKVFSWNTHFSVKDENGIDRFTVEGERFTLGKRLHVYDGYRREVALIQQKTFSFLPRFFVYVEGEKIAEIVKEFSFLRPKYRIVGPEWEINGDFWGHMYSITQYGKPIVSISKAWLTWGDVYELDIENPNDTLPALAVVLAIDCATAQQAVAASVS